MPLKSIYFRLGWMLLKCAQRDATHYRWVSSHDGKTRWLPTVLTFDAHCLEHFGRSERVTHIKMTSLGLRGLKEAFTFPDTRIRFPSTLPDSPTQRVLGIEISGGNHSFFRDVRVAFAENLTCLIGARGSGKSTVVEAFRYAFGYNRTLAELGRLEAPVRELQAANLIDARVRVVYQTRSGAQRILEATFDPKEDYSTRVYDVDGQPLEIADVEKCGDYPLRLFGWSEIETLGREPSRQRDLLDRLIVELGEPLRRRDEFRSKLRENRGAITNFLESIRAAFAAGGGEIRRYREYLNDFQALNTNDVQELFAALDEAKSKVSVLDKVEQNTKAVLQRLQETPGTGVRHGLEQLLESMTPTLRAWWHSEELRNRLRIDAADSNLQATVGEAISRIRSIETLVVDYRSEVQATVASLEQQLRERFAADSTMQRIADLRQNAEKRLGRVRRLREDYLQKFSSLRGALDDRTTLADDLVRVQNEIAGIRVRHNEAIQDKLNAFLPADMIVTIEFRPGGDTEVFESRLQEIFGRRSSQQKRIAKSVAGQCVPIRLAKMALSGEFSEIVGLGTQDSILTEEDARLCGDKLLPFTRDEFADVEILTAEGRVLDTVLDLHEIEWDDWETVRLNNRPVNETSPGQRSSAMLPLVALAESAPLLIDQPEDNLDRRLIGNVLVHVLAELKERRQIIVCTHDPNILVGGDAEQVVVLEAESDRRSKVLLHGSIDNDDIVDTVVDLLEGGAEAFENRRKRYRDRVGEAR